MASPTSIKLDDEMKERVRNLADGGKRTSRWIMREAIARYVEREERREASRRDTLKAWEELRTCGLHATAEEVDRWLAGSGDRRRGVPPWMPQVDIRPPGRSGMRVGSGLSCVPKAPMPRVGPARLFGKA